jgi:hypothetical protein
MPVRDAKACDVSLVEQWRADRRGRINGGKRRAILSKDSSGLDRQLGMNMDVDREIRVLEEIKKERQYVDRGEGKLPLEIQIEI